MKIKNKVNNNVQLENPTDEMKKLVILILVVTAFFFIFYGITILILKKDNKEVEEIKEVTKIDYEKILVSQILSQPENNYYVIVTIENDANNTTYASLIEKYYEKENHKKVYSINLNDPMNKTFMGDKTNLQGEVKNFKFEKSTLLEIQDKTIKSIFDGSTDMLEKLNNLE